MQANMQSKFKHEIVVLMNGEEVTRVDAGAYHLIMYEDGLMMRHDDALMIDKLSAIGMGGKVIERIGLYAKSMNAPVWWVTFIMFQANLLMKVVEYVEKTWGMLPVRISESEYHKMLNIAMEQANNSAPPDNIPI